MKNILVHLLRGISYVAFPVGVLLFGLFIISASSNDLDFTTTRNILINTSAILFFFAPPVIILFLHLSPKRSNGIVESNTDQTPTARIKFDSRYLPVVILLGILGAGLLFFGLIYLIFLGLVTGG